MKKSFLFTLLGVVMFSLIVIISCNRKDVGSSSIADNSTKDMLVSYLVQQKQLMLQQVHLLTL